MDFDPVEVQKHLKGVDYPASGEELASIAESNDASKELFEESRAGSVALGSCVVWPEAPKRRCVACGFEWHDEEVLSRAAK